jgi:hypothetical protein
MILVMGECIAGALILAMRFRVSARNASYVSIWKNAAELIQSGFDRCEFFVV